MKIVFNLSIILACTFTACTSKYIQKADLSTVPSDFNPNKHIVLLAEVPIQGDPDGDRHNKRTEELGNTFKKNYKYRYEVVSLKELEKNNKYKDTSVYKFVLLNKYGVYTANSPARYSTTGSIKHEAYSISIDLLNFYFYDRARVKEYPPVMPANLNKFQTSIQVLIAILDRAQQERGNSR